MSSPSMWNGVSTISLPSTCRTRSVLPTESLEGGRVGLGVTPAARRGVKAQPRLPPQQPGGKLPMDIAHHGQREFMLADERGRRLAGGELRMFEQPDQEMP